MAFLSQSRPGFREYRIRNYDPDYYDLLFPEVYLSNLNFEWPFSDDAIFTSPKNDKNNPPRLSGVFKEYASSINNWWMAEDFFVIYDELRPCFSLGYRFEGTAPKRTPVLGGLINEFNTACFPYNSQSHRDMFSI